MNDFNHQLAGFYSGEHIHTHRFLLYRICKLLGNLEVDVGIQQGTTHILKGFSHIYLGDFAFTFQYLERPFKSIT